RPDPAEGHQGVEPLAGGREVPRSPTIGALAFDAIGHHDVVGYPGRMEAQGFRLCGHAGDLFGWNVVAARGQEDSNEHGLPCRQAALVASSGLICSSRSIARSASPVRARGYGSDSIREIALLGREARNASAW